MLSVSVVNHYFTENALRNTKLAANPSQYANWWLRSPSKQWQWLASWCWIGRVLGVASQVVNISIMGVTQWLMPSGSLAFGM